MDRRQPLSAKAYQLEGERQSAMALLRQRVPDLRVDLEPVTGAPRFVWSHSGFIQDRLPAGDGGQVDPCAAIRAFLESNRALFGHGAEVLDPAQIARDYVTPHNGMRTIVWQQEFDEIPIFRAVLYGHVTKTGELVAITSQFVPRPAEAADRGTPNRAAAAAQPPVSAQTALSKAAGWLGDSIDSTALSSSSDPAAGRKRTQTLQGGGLADPATVEPVWLPMGREALRLCWRVVVRSSSSRELFQVVVDAIGGEALVSDCWTARISNASYRVFASDSPSPMTPGHAAPSTSQPPLVNRSLQTLAALSTTASPNGWINDGETRTIGNNVDARLVLDNITPDYDNRSVPRPQSTSRVFDYGLDLNQEPTTIDNRNSAVVNAFYWANWMHDRLYDLGFTEAAGNFQQANFGRGGIGGDAILVNVQHGYNSGNRNQSWMDASPTDGPGLNVMKLSVFNAPNPDRDAALEAETILHEYTHAMVQRLVGQGVAVSQNPQPWGMNEGWSDFFALAMLAQSSDNLAGNYPFGGYALYLWTPPSGGLYTGATLTENYYYEKNTYPFSTDLSKHPVTLRDIDPAQASSHAGVSRNPVSRRYNDPTDGTRREFEEPGFPCREPGGPCVSPIAHA